MRCPYCGKEAEWVSNEVVYGRRYGKSYMCYYCRDCDSYVGCHNNTREALGTMANRELRQLRIQAHAVFDPLWKTGKMSRQKAYKYLNGLFNKKIHIGQADEETCRAIIQKLISLAASGPN